MRHIRHHDKPYTSKIEVKEEAVNKVLFHDTKGVFKFTHLKHLDFEELEYIRQALIKDEE